MPIFPAFLFVAAAPPLKGYVLGPKGSVVVNGRKISASREVSGGKVTVGRGGQALLFSEPVRKPVVVKGPATATLGPNGWSVVPASRGRLLAANDWGSAVAGLENGGTTERSVGDYFTWAGPRGRVPDGPLVISWRGRFEGTDAFEAWSLTVQHEGESVWKGRVTGLGTRSAAIPDNVLRPGRIYRVFIDLVRVAGDPVNVSYDIEVPSEGVCKVLKAARTLPAAARAELLQSAGCQWAAAEILKGLPNRQAEAERTFRTGEISTAASQAPDVQR